MPTNNSDDFDATYLQARRKDIERTLSALIAAGDHHGLSVALSELARICVDQGEGLQALIYRRRQLAEAEQLDDLALEAAAMLETACAAAAVGEQWEAEQLFRRAAA